MGVGGVKIGKMGSQSQSLTPSLLIPHPLDFITSMVLPFPEETDCANANSDLTSSWARRPKVEFVLSGGIGSLDYKETTAHQMTLKLDQWAGNMQIRKPEPPIYWLMAAVMSQRPSPNVSISAVG